MTGVHEAKLFAAVTQAQEYRNKVDSMGYGAVLAYRDQTIPIAGKGAGSDSNAAWRRALVAAIDELALLDPEAFDREEISLVLIAQNPGFQKRLRLTVGHIAQIELEKSKAELPHEYEDWREAAIKIRLLKSFEARKPIDKSEIAQLKVAKVESEKQCKAAYEAKAYLAPGVWAEGSAQIEVPNS